MLLKFGIELISYRTWPSLCPYWLRSGGFYGEQITFFGPWADDGNASCGKFIENSNLLAFEVKVVASLWTFGVTDNYHFNHFFAQHGHAIKDISSLTPFKHLFIAEEPIPHISSELYQLLGSATPNAKPLFVRAWECDIGLAFSEAQLTHLYQLTHSSSLD